MAKQQDQLRDARQRVDPESADAVVGALVAEALCRGCVSTSMSAARFRRALGAFAGTLLDANQLVGHLRLGPYRSYGPVFDYPGVAALVDGSTVFELCELAARVDRESARRAKLPSMVRTYVQRAFTVEVRARTLYTRRPVQGTCRRSRPREFHPRRQRTASSPRRARAPGRPGSDEPHPEPVAVPEARR